MYALYRSPAAFYECLIMIKLFRTTSTQKKVWHCKHTGNPLPKNLIARQTEMKISHFMAKVSNLKLALSKGASRGKIETAANVIWTWPLQSASNDLSFVVTWSCRPFPIGLVKTESGFIVRSVETGLGRWMLVVAVISVDAYLFLAFSDLTCCL